MGHHRDLPCLIEINATSVSTSYIGADITRASIDVALVLPAASVRGTRTSMWRVEDEGLLQRLEDEHLVEALRAHLVGHVQTPAHGSGLHPRAGGLIAELRRLAGGSEAVRASLHGDVGRLARFIDAQVLNASPPTLLHHLALFHSKAAAALETKTPDAAAIAWERSLSAWFALAEERTYLTRLEASVLGDARPGRVGLPPEQVPLEVIAEIARRAERSARELGPAGRAALIALGRIDEAARAAATSAATAQRARAEAERCRNAAIESALAVIVEGLDEASARGELGPTGRTLLLRAVAVWTWTSNDEAVEHFVVERIDKIGWELYRARNWDALRYLLDPFRAIFESLAARIARDGSQLAYAAACAQMFVFLAEVDLAIASKRVLAERAVEICPTHRNGRLVLASVLCDEALEAMRAMVLFARSGDLRRVEGLLKRAEALYPQTSELPEAKGMLERVKKGRIAV